MRLILSLCLVIVVGLFSAASCSLDTSPLLDDTDAGSVGGSGGGTVECWAGQKVCNGECFTYEDPEAGCGSTSCDPCIVPNAQATCVDNVCKVGSCLPGWADCDGNDFEPACEKNVASDPEFCGGCVGSGTGENCKTKVGPAGEIYVCKNGSCVVDNCPPPLGDCDTNPADCEVNHSQDVNNCGFCGNACTFANATSACVPEAATKGLCTFTCNPGFANCNGSNPGGGSASDPQGQIDGCEINLTTDIGNCGACGVVCPGVTNGLPVCNNGVCGIVCSAPYIPCNGQCVHPQQDENHCGGCNEKCEPPPGGVAFCNNGTCAFNCTGSLTQCGAACVDTTTNSAHCGGCSKPCTPPTGGNVECVGSACVQSCPGGQSVCGNACVNLQNNTSNCGTCGNTCKAYQICQGGACTCPSGQFDCGNKCAACCGNQHCTPPRVCNTTSGSCVCPSGSVTCGGACCTGGKICSGGCVCPNDTHDCGNGTCEECCNNTHCGTGQTCSGNQCVCDGAHPQDCGDYCAVDCCNNSDCMGNGLGGDVCLQNGTCGCPTDKPKICQNECRECCNGGDCPGEQCCSGGVCAPSCN